jgi:hypothetical protein
MVRSSLAMTLLFAAGCGKGGGSGKPAGGSDVAAGSARDAGATVGAPPDSGGVPDPAPPRTPNEFLVRGTPTFVLGTAGDDRADRGIAAHVGMVRDVLFPTAQIVTDTSIVANGVWPMNPVVYGGPHVNALVDRVKLCLPFSLASGSLVVGSAGVQLAGTEYALVTVVPPRAAGGDCPGHPAFLLYAGTGTPGVEGINSRVVTRGAEPLVIADAYGRLHGGTYDGASVRLDGPAARPTWNHSSAQMENGQVVIAIRSAGNAALDETLRGAVKAAAAKLGLADAAIRVSMHVYADAATKQAASGDGGDGHAVLYAGALHVRGNMPVTLLARLLEHEATHVILPQTVGGAGSVLLGEGIAVWVSGQYGSKSLARWNAEIATAPPIAELLTTFSKLPEPEAYPLGGLLVEAAVAEVGIEKVRDHLYLATAATWADACTAAGTTPEKLQAAFTALLAK